MPKKSLVIKVAIAVAIAIAVLLAIGSSRKSKRARRSSSPSLIPASEGFDADGLPEYRDVEYFSEEFDEES